MKVKPAVSGSVVRFPYDPKRALKDEGEDVPDDDTYWNRWLRDGSVVRVGAPTGNEPIAPLSTR
jgi:hypothetical protein